MKRLESLEELTALARRLASRTRSGTTLRVCATGCRALGALDVCVALEAEIARRGLAQRARVVQVGCHGLCAGAVTMVIDPQGIFYMGVTPDDAAEIVEKTVAGGRIIKRLCWSRDGRTFAHQQDIPFYKNQMRRVLKNCGVVDPKSLEDALAHGAYAAAAAVLGSRRPEEVIAEVERSGLRGRGGAGFPTGRKWQLARQAQGDPKYIICNADEGDPGSFKDRVLLEGDPHLVIEGMIIGAYAVGAAEAFNYIRAEYPLAIEFFKAAVCQAREAGLLGKNILGTGFDFDIVVVQGAGAYVCGEETSLLTSIEGQRAMPRVRPPFPVARGLYGKPTTVNNVETWANVPRVIELGAEAFASVGTTGSKGTKIFSLAGAVRNAGVAELPIGATLRQIVFDIGGGIPRGRKFKAAQIGGPCGGCVPAQYLDLPVDYDSLKAIGAMMGCGGIIVLDEGTCMVDLARNLSQFARDESCGKCVPCRVGNTRIFQILTRMVRGEGHTEELRQVQDLCELINLTSLCGMAPNPVLSTIRFFAEEYEAHVARHRCPANVCQGMAGGARGRKALSRPGGARPSSLPGGKGV